MRRFFRFEFDTLLFDRFGFFRPKHDKKATTTKSLDNHDFLLRLVATSFEHDKSVLQEDADNFTTFFLEQLVQDGNFAVELSPDAVQEFSSLANQVNPDILRDLGKKYKVEALVRGRVKEYSYKLGRREFSISLNLEIEGINTHFEIFDIEKLSEVFILSSIWGSWHSILDYNLRYYFNPYTLKLEPMPTDQLWPVQLNSNNPIEELLHYKESLPKIFRLLAKSKEFEQAVINNFDTISLAYNDLESLYTGVRSIFSADRIHDFSMNSLHFH